MKKLVVILTCITAAFSNEFLGQNTLAGWNYNTIVGAPAAPLADIGTGTSNVLSLIHI